MSDDPASLQGGVTLRSVLLNFRLGEMLRGDLLVGVAGAAGAVWLGFNNRQALLGAVPTAAALVGVVVGVVIATATIVAAFLNPVFLRKLRAINEDPVDYLAPYLLSGVLGVVASIACVVLAALPATAPTWVVATIGGVSGFFTLWALASLVPNLTNLVGFIRLQADAAEVPDDLPVIGPRGAQTPPSDRRPASSN
jgi:hypothetical protein